MKYVPNRLFGYPVLLDEVAEDTDYPNKKISAEVKLVLNQEDISNYTVIYDLSLDSDTLNKLVHEGKAAFVIRVSCNASLFSKSEICDNSGSFNISGDELRDKAEISVFLVATKNLTLGAINREFHSDYDASEFDISPGMVLAYPAPVTYFISKENFLDVTSIFKWSPRPNHESGTFSVDLHDQKIEIVSLESQIQTFKEWMRRDESKFIAYNSVFLSALTHAIEMLKQDRDQYEENRWANTILTKCQNENIDIDSNRWPALKIAQRLLHSPIKLLNSTISGSGD